MGSLLSPSVLTHTRNNVSYLIYFCILENNLLKVLNTACNMIPSPELGLKPRQLWKDPLIS